MNLGAAPTQAWELVIHEATGAGIPCPPDWQRERDPGGAILLVEPYAATQSADRSFRPNVSVVVERPHPALRDIAAFTTRMVDNMVLGLTDLHVIDLEVVEVAGHEGRRILAGHRSGQYALALEQWWTIVDGIGTTISGSCAVEDYLRASPVFELVAAGLVLPSRVEGG